MTLNSGKQHDTKDWRNLLEGAQTSHETSKCLAIGTVSYSPAYCPVVSGVVLEVVPLITSQHSVWQSTSPKLLSLAQIVVFLRMTQHSTWGHSWRQYPHQLHRCSIVKPRHGRLCCKPNVTPRTRSFIRLRTCTGWRPTINCSVNCTCSSRDWLTNARREQVTSKIECTSHTDSELGERMRNH